MNNYQRKLLRDAADAAGLQYDPTRLAPYGLWVVRPDAKGQEDQGLWNPLHTHADALWLAAKLRLYFDWRGTYAGRLDLVKRAGTTARKDRNGA